MHDHVQRHVELCRINVKWPKDARALVFSWRVRYICLDMRYKENAIFCGEKKKLLIPNRRHVMSEG